MKSNRQTKPRARKDELVVHELPDETLIYDLDRDRAYCLNETAAFVWQRCDGRKSAREIAQALGKKINAHVDSVWRSNVEDTLALSARKISKPGLRQIEESRRP